MKEYLYYLFTPKENNNYRAKTLHINFLSFYLIGALLFAFTVKNVGFYFNNVLGFATDITVNRLIELTNKERGDRSLPPLQYNKALSYAAQAKAKDMFEKNYWSHFAPNGTTPWDFILNSGYQYEYAGENLAKNFLFSQGVVDAWMNSPTHKENVLKKEYTEVGFAIVNGMMNGEETTLVVQMFGTPLNISTTVKQPEVQHPVNISKENLLGKETQAVIAKENVKPKINLLHFSFDTIYIFIFFLVLILIADFYIASRLQIVRIGGKHIAHIIFLGFIMLGVIFIMKSGAIL